MLFKSKVYKDGEVIIPIQLRRKLSIEEGDEIVFVYSDGELKVITEKNSLDERASSGVLKKSPDLNEEPVTIQEKMREE